MLFRVGGAALAGLLVLDRGPDLGPRLLSGALTGGLDTRRGFLRSTAPPRRGRETPPPRARAPRNRPRSRGAPSSPKPAPRRSRSRRAEARPSSLRRPHREAAARRKSAPRRAAGPHPRAARSEAARTWYPVGPARARPRAAAEGRRYRRAAGAPGWERRPCRGPVRVARCRAPAGAAVDRGPRSPARAAPGRPPAAPAAAPGARARPRPREAAPRCPRGRAPPRRSAPRATRRARGLGLGLGVEPLLARDFVLPGQLDLPRNRARRLADGLIGGLRLRLRDQVRGP